MFKKYNLDLTGLMQYVANQLKSMKRSVISRSGALGVEDERLAVVNELAWLDFALFL